MLYKYTTNHIEFPKFDYCTALSNQPVIGFWEYCTSKNEGQNRLKAYAICDNGRAKTFTRIGGASATA